MNDLLSLPQDELRAFFHGGTATLAKGEVSLSRFSEAFGPFYTEEPARLVRRNCTAGVVLRFRSEATRIDAGLTFAARARPNVTFELLVDGELAQRVVPDGEAASWDGVLWECTDGGEREFALWFPAMAEARLHRFCADAAFTPVAPAPFRWIALGDSITQGMSASAPTLTWVARVAACAGWDVLNAGVGGARMDARLANAIAGERYDLVTVAFGTNDYHGARPLEEFRQTYVDFLTTLKLPAGARCCLIAPPAFPASPENAQGVKLAAYQEAVAEVAARFPGVLCFQPGLADDFALFNPDGCHPNDDGMMVYAANLNAFLNR